MTMTPEEIEGLRKAISELPWPKLNYPDEAEMRDLGYAALPILQRLDALCDLAARAGELQKQLEECQAGNRIWRDRRDEALTRAEAAERKLEEALKLVESYRVLAVQLAPEPAEQRAASGKVWICGNREGTNTVTPKMTPREHAIAAICPLSGEPKGAYEVGMVRMLTEFAERVLAAPSTNAAGRGSVEIAASAVAAPEASAPAAPDGIQLDRDYWRAQGIEACMDRMQLIANQKAPDGWISVEERFPNEALLPHEGYVLAYMDGAIDCLAFYDGRFINWTSPASPNVYPEEVTHWRPLPSPPSKASL